MRRKPLESIQPSSEGGILTLGSHALHRKRVDELVKDNSLHDLQDILRPVFDIVRSRLAY